MLEPYESIYVGNFIFTLGYLTRAKDIKLSSQSVALMAQNVGDEVIADLISSWEGKNFIIEFKRNEKTVQSEFAKKHKKRLIRLLNEKRRGSEARNLASRGHFLGYGKFGSKETPTGLYFSQYHKIRNENVQTKERVSLTYFIFEIIIKAKWGLTDSELSDYIEILAKTFTSSDSESGGVSATALKAEKAQKMSSLLINYNESKAEINFIACDLSKAKELRLEKDISTKQDINKTASIEFNGPSM